MIKVLTEVLSFSITATNDLGHFGKCFSLNSFLTSWHIKKVFLEELEARPPSAVPTFSGAVKKSPPGAREHLQTLSSAALELWFGLPWHLTSSPTSLSSSWESLALLWSLLSWQTSAWLILCLPLYPSGFPEGPSSCLV